MTASNPQTNANIVRKLTRPDSARRVFVTLLAATPVLASPLAAADWHPTDDIAAVAEAFLERRLGPDAANARVEAGMLDARLRVARCSQPLESFLRPGTRLGAKTTVGVRCPGSRPWKIYVPVETVVRRRVWVVREALPRGHLLSAADLVADERDIARMTRGYISDPERLVGQRLRTSVLAGRVLTRQLIEADTVIRRGQTVTLAASAGGVRIRMAGKALADGALNERIRVENLNSGRIVEGIVRSRELVEVLLPESGSFFNAMPKVSAATADTRYSNNDR